MPKAMHGEPPGAAAIQFSRRPGKRRLQEWRQGYLFLAPALIVLGIFIGIAAVFVVYLSFHKVNLFTNSYTSTGRASISCPRRICRQKSRTPWTPYGLTG